MHLNKTRYNEFKNYNVEIKNKHAERLTYATTKEEQLMLRL